MERSEPTFVPEWLKSGGSLTTTSHQFHSSLLHSDEQGVLKTTRNKSLVNISNNDSVSEKTTSSYFRRTCSSNASSLRSYSSFGRYSDKEKSENRHRDYSDPLGNVLLRRFEKEGLRRSHSSVSAKRGESWPRKVVADSSSDNSAGGCVKTTFEKEFPSLGAEEKQTDSEIGRVPSPGLATAFQTLPVGNSSVIGGDGWTSALAEVPVIVGSNGSNTSVVQSASISSPTSMTSGRNMAETLAQGPPRALTAPQLSVGTQRLEELAVKQSRQLIPMTPSMPKALVLNSCDKPKPKVAPLQLQSCHAVNNAHSPRSVPTKVDSPKTSTVGKLHVLKPSRERNGVPLNAKDNLSPTGGSKSLNSPLAVPSVPLRNPGNIPPIAVVERKPGVTTLEKRSSSQVQSRNDFFNLMRKKSMTPVIPDTVPSVSASDKPGEVEAPTVTKGGVQQSSENESDTTCNGDAHVATERFKSNNSGSDAIILYSEEEEARFLRSLGWDETAEEEEGLTEEEINSFYRDVSKYLNLQAASKIFKGTQPKILMLHSQMGNNGDISSDSKLKS